MPYTLVLLAAALTLFTSTLAFSPDQCNATSYGRPDRSACNTLLTNIGKLGTGNTSYLFIPTQFATPDGLSNGTRKNFPQTWSTTGCNAALVPIEEDDDDGSSASNDTSVTYDTSTYQDLASVGAVVVQQCISNKTRASGGWELAGDMEALVLHLYASGSEIDQTLKQQTSTEIAATSEDEVEEAELDDPEYQDVVSGFDDGGTNSTGTNSTGTNSTSTASNDTTADGQLPPSTSNTATVAAAAPQTVKKSATFSYTGCEADNANSRTLSSKQWSGQNLTVERCADYCSGYQYMGVEFGSQCYCGGDANGKGVKPAKIVTTGTTSCTTPCNGDDTQVCGGDAWLSLYQNSLTASAGATA